MRAFPILSNVEPRCYAELRIMIEQMGVLKELGITEIEDNEADGMFDIIPIDEYTKKLETDFDKLNR